MSFDPRHLPSNNAGCGGDPLRLPSGTRQNAFPLERGRMGWGWSGAAGVLAKAAQNAKQGLSGYAPPSAWPTRPTPGGPFPSLPLRPLRGHFPHKGGKIAAAVIVALALVTGFFLFAPTAKAETTLTIAHIQLKKDPRYGKSRAQAQYLQQPTGRPWAGSKLALEEVKWHGAAAGVSFALTRKKVRKAADVATTIRQLATAQDIRFFLLDLPAPAMAETAAALKDEPLILFNISAYEDMLRGPGCQTNLLHILPSHAMLADALGQYLKLRKWDEVLVLTGPQESDKAWADAFRRTAKRYGIDIDDERGFVLSNDPRIREENNPVLLTGGADYDVVFVADTDGEFARNMHYAIKDPRPLVGAEGLAPLAWHWAWERNGGPQLEKRFQEAAGRPMRDRDWAAWLGVKAVAEAVQRTASADFDTLHAYLTGPDLVLDTFKGNRSNFRPWNGQLRQPVLLGTHNWVVARAPIEGFLHKTDNLDTLGHDQRESTCKR